jgi:glycosyltransferase involved in cell wall biosynthesis
MTTAEFDILFVADARFPGGTSTALANEIAAAHRAGFRFGLIHVAGPVLRRGRAFHRAIRSAIDTGAVELLDPSLGVRARLAIVHHPMLFDGPLKHPIAINAEHSVLVAHHPAIDGKGDREYDIRRQLELVEENLGLKALVGPVGRNVRKTLRRSRIEMTPSDWHNLIDARRWRRGFRPFGSPVVIGRHSRPDLLKWPDRARDILAAYPPDPHYRIEILGAGDFLGQRLHAIPNNWRLHPFGSLDVREFLHGLDAYVYFHSSRWIEAFGYGVLEALACGLPTIVPKSFEPLFGEGAVYAKPAEVEDVLRRFETDRKALRAQRDRALAIVAERYSLEEFPRRLDRMFGLRPRRRLFAASRAPRAERKQRVALFMSSNGVGLGHLTREMAIARRLPETIQPVFFTLSRAARLAREAGYMVEHVPFHRYLKTTPDRWNSMIERELGLVLDFYLPDVLIFDGNVPYSGLIRAMRKRPAIRSVWIRRGMWRADEGGILKRARDFDMVVEPGDYAGGKDVGPTSALRGETVLVEPVVMVDPGERLSRREARRALGLKARTVVALQLGSGTNFDFSRARERIIDMLLDRRDVDVVELLSPVSDDAADPEPLAEWHRPMRLYPAYRYSRAFDAAICAAGYNSFHENLAGGVPTLFVANRAEEMDRQDLRAEYAATEQRMALSWSGLNLPALEREVERLLDSRRRARMRRRMAGLSHPHGAEQIAKLIEELVLTAR